MKWVFVVLAAAVVGGVVGSGVAVATGPGEDDVRAAAIALVPDGVDVVDEFVDTPPALSPVRPVGVRMSFPFDSADAVTRRAEGLGWDVVTPGRFRRGGLEATITGPVDRDGGPSMSVFVERNADTLAGRITIGAILGAVAGGVVAMGAHMLRRRHSPTSES